MKNAIHYSLMLLMAVASAPLLSVSASGSGTAHNAYNYFAEAGAAMDDQGGEVSQALGTDGAAPAGHVFTLSEKDALIRRNAKALRLLRQGFAYPYKNPRTTDPKLSRPDFSVLFRLRSLARILKLEAQVRAAHGDWSGAVNSDLDAVQMGEMCVHGGAVLHELVGIAVQAIGRVDIGNKVAHLTAPQCRKAIARMDQIAAMHTPYTAVLKQDEKEELSDMRAAFRHPDWRRRYAKDVLGDETMVSELRTTDKKTLIRQYVLYTDKLISASRRPYNVAVLQRIHPAPAIGFVAMNAAPLIMEITSQATHSLLRAEIGLQAYRAEHHQYPATLALLTPAMLPTPTTDPFNGSAPLGYRLSGESYVLYSVGPDGHDDHGLPIDNHQLGQGRIRSRVFPQSKGDIVAGVNTN